MQSKNQKYSNIIDITKKVHAALEESEPSTLRKLAYEIRSACNEISKNDLENIKNIEALISEATGQVNSIVKIVQKKIDEKRCELKKISNKKKIAATYGKL